MEKVRDLQLGMDAAHDNPNINSAATYRNALS
jgi:hypothetical protein